MKLNIVRPLLCGHCQLRCSTRRYDLQRILGCHYSRYIAAHKQCSFFAKKSTTRHHNRKLFWQSCHRRQRTFWACPLHNDTDNLLGLSTNKAKDTGFCETCRYPKATFGLNSSRNQHLPPSRTLDCALGPKTDTAHRGRVTETIFYILFREITASAKCAWCKSEIMQTLPVRHILLILP